MEGEPEKKNIEQNVLAAIRSGEVKMRPRWRFILNAALVAVGVTILFLALLFLVSFIFFMLRHTGVGLIPAFGFGWIMFFRRLPWVLIGLVVVFIVVLEVLVRRYAFAYKRPLVASVLSILGVVLIGGVILAATNLHRQLLTSAQHNGLPPMIGGMYRGFGMPRFNDIRRGEIVQIAGNIFVIQDEDGDTSTIVVTPGTRLPFGDAFTSSDTVVVFGVPGPDGTVRALGIQKVFDQ